MIRFAELYARLDATTRTTDKVEALKWHWIAKSAGKGDTELDEYLADLSPADRAKAEEASRKWLGNK